MAPPLLHDAIASRPRDQHTLYCCSCFTSSAPKLFKCSQCKLVLYCSRECQKRVHGAHKHACKALADASGTTKPLIMGDLVFRTAYMSCDTIERGAFMLEQALDAFLEEVPSETTDTMQRRAVTERIHFTLAALGHAELSFKSLIYANTTEPAQAGKEWKLTDTPWETDSNIKPLSEWHLGDLFTLVYIKLKVRVEEEEQETVGQSTVNAPAVTTASTDDDQVEAKLQDLVDATSLDTQLQHLTQLIGRELVLLQKAIPLRSTSIPKLFHGIGSEELYMFVQDAFFLSPKVHRKLMDYADEEDYDDDSDCD